MSVAAPAPVAVFLFTRGLRLADNTALNAAAAAGAPILPIFVFTPEQADPKANKYFSATAFQFMVESLSELDGELRARGSRLHCFAGDTVDVLGALAGARGAGGTGGVGAVYENADITPYARERSRRIAAWCDANGAEYRGVAGDHDLIAMDRGRTKDGAMYSVFTAYWRNAVATELPGVKPTTARALSAKGAWAPALADNALRGFGPMSADALRSRAEGSGGAGAAPPPEDYVNPGGRREALRRLKRFVAAGGVAEYREARDTPGRAGTSRLGAAIRFGVVSVRECAWAAAGSEGAKWDGAFIQELTWRSFYYHWMWERPTLLDRSFHADYDLVAWRDVARPAAEGGAREEWRAFLRGRTGFPLIDAGVRELGATGWCHNRVRMMLATFVVKGMRVDWRIGERWMARLLRDHDVVSNCMGWQWGASAAPSAQPYFRVMSPWAQLARFDADAAYTHRWLSELAGVSAKYIARWGEPKIRERALAAAAASGAAGGGVDYPAPMFEWKERAAEAIAAWRVVARA